MKKICLPLPIPSGCIMPLLLKETNEFFCFLSSLQPTEGIMILFLAKKEESFLEWSKVEQDTFLSAIDRNLSKLEIKNNDYFLSLRESDSLTEKRTPVLVSVQINGNEDLNPPSSAKPFKTGDRFSSSDCLVTSSLFRKSWTHKWFVLPLHYLRGGEMRLILDKKGKMLPEWEYLLSGYKARLNR